MTTVHGADAGRLGPPPARHTGARSPVHALSADAALLQCLPTLPRRGAVHSAFERVINVDAGGDRLISLAHRDSDDAPDTVVVDIDSWAASRLASGIEVRLSPRRIVLGGDVFIALDGVRPWYDRLPAYAPDDAVLRANLPAAQDHVEHHGSGIGLRRAAGAAPGAVDRATATAFGRGTRGLCEAIARGDDAAARDHVGRLVGLGPGLTPSGDDFLLGLLAALNLPDGPCRAPRCVGERVVECADTQTHRISAAALRHAAAGRVRASVSALSAALMGEPAATMAEALDRVLRIGSGSGTEIALGLLAGFRLHLATDGRQPLPAAGHDSSGATDGR